MKRTWHPSASQRREFAARMQQPEEKAAYELRKAMKAEKRRADSAFDYNTAGGRYVPTEVQNNFCMYHPERFDTPEKITAAEAVMYGYSCGERVHHDYIHVVNTIIRNNQL